MKFVDEFKDFISRGNVVDMAVGVVVGGAFKSIVDSLVADIIDPGIAYVVSLITGALKTALQVQSVTQVPLNRLWICLNG